jgi:hypothetical protein
MLTSTGTYDDNVLYQLAQTMASGGRHSTAIALRLLAQAGYATLEQVDTASDWVLLSIRGIGVGRLREVRLLTRADWEPPSPQAMHAANWFLSSARFALRYWPPETLASVIQGSSAEPVSEGPVEKRLAMDVFSHAVRQALRHCEAEVWILALRQMMGQRDRQPHGRIESHQVLSSQSTLPTPGQQQPSTANPLDTPPGPGVTAPESDHYAFSSEERRQIVEHYRTARRNGEVENKEAWAYSNYHISRKTLWRYEQEFPETECEHP